MDKELQPYKYRFDDYKRNRKIRLPDDINDVIREAVKPLDCQELVGTIDNIQQKRLFGDIYVYTSAGVLITKIVFQSGICNKYDIIHNPSHPVITKPFNVVFLRSERNRLVSFRSSVEEVRSQAA